MFKGRSLSRLPPRKNAPWVLNKFVFCEEKAVVGLGKAVVGLGKAVVGLEKAVVGLEKAVVGLEKAVVGLGKAVVSSGKWPLVCSKRRKNADSMGPK